MALAAAAELAPWKSYEKFTNLVGIIFNILRVFSSNLQEWKECEDGGVRYRRQRVF